MALGKFHSLAPSEFSLNKIILRRLTMKLFIPRQIAGKKAIQCLVTICLYFLLCELYREVVVPVYSFGGFDLATDSQHELVIPILLIFGLVVPDNARTVINPAIK